MKKQHILLLIFITVISNVFAQDNKIGSWFTDSKGLPAFEYTGSIPYSAFLSNGDKVKLPADPWFLLGNYRLTLFTHVSGKYELITGEREWGRLNQGEQPNSGSNSATLSVLGNSKKDYELTGMKSLAANPEKCKRTFGCGFAEYSFHMDGLECTRNLSVKPSTNPYNGTSAFLITITLHNSKNKPVELLYTESITANYVPMQQQRIKEDERKIKYEETIINSPEYGIILANITAKADDPFLFPDSEMMSQYDGYPPSLFLKIINGTVKGKVFSEKNNNSDELISQFQFKLAPNEKKSFQIVVGYTFNPNLENIDDLAKELFNKEEGSNKFADAWKRVLPLFEDEKDDVFKREMVWNAYNLEAMATFSQFYNETKIPQGTVYDYDWGLQASARDNFQHALPLPHYNPKLAKSVIRYMMKRTTPWGQIRLIEFGNGYSNSLYFFTSDQQLFSFMLLAEYLRVTNDYGILKEKVAFFPYRNMPEASLLDCVEAQFRYLRDEVGLGEHGLVRLLNSDWNDAIYHIAKKPYNDVLYKGESHMNTAMAVTILDDLIIQLDKANNHIAMESNSNRLGVLITSMKLYQQCVNKAFIKDLGDRTFSRRMYFAGKSYGDDNMFLEPQGYMLQMKGLSVIRKKELYKEMQNRVYKGEKIAAREQQNPEFESSAFEKGSRENGGVWWALNGPVILGVSQFDKPEAWRLLKKMTFDNFAHEFPKYWSSYWSQADNWESSLMPGEGLPDQTSNYGDMPVYCAHAHAWPLYCYFRLKE